MTAAVSYTDATYFPSKVDFMALASSATRAVARVSSANTIGMMVEALSRQVDTAIRIAIPTASNVVAHDRNDLLAIARIRQFGAYPEGWKGPGSAGASDVTVDDAEKFVKQLFEVELKIMPHIGLVSDGEINFYWKSAGLAIDLSITGDGTYSFFAECEDGVSYAGEEQIGTELPSGILSKIRAGA